MITFKLKYFKQVDNWIDLAIITLMVLVMYVPNGSIWNPKIFSVFDEDPYMDEEKTCRVKRCISAIVIVFTWVRFLMSVAKNPGWKEYNPVSYTHLTLPTKA